jgi:hypothetical protein
MLAAYIYKQTHIPAQESLEASGASTLYELKETIALKKVWADKKTSKKVMKLKALVPPSKVKWEKKSNKITAKFSNLSSNELNKITTTLLNLAISIQKLNIKKSGSSYSMELKCKW